MRNLLGGWQAFAVGSALFAALTAVLAKIGVERVDADLATFVRTVVILAVTAALVTARGEWRAVDLDLRGLAFLTLSGLATGLSWVCYFRALQLGPASRVAPIDRLSVVLVVVIAAVFLGERPQWPVIVGAALIAAGAVLVALPSKP